MPPRLERKSEPPRSTGGFYARRFTLTKEEKELFKALHSLLPVKEKPKAPPKNPLVADFLG